MVENTVGKAEIARYEQFLLFPQCFQKTRSANTLKTGLDWERVNSLPHKPDFSRPYKRNLENIVGKGENAGYQHFLLFPQCFLLIP